jgi:hypothetical protein
VVVLRRRLPETLALTRKTDEGQVEQFCADAEVGTAVWEFANLVTSLDPQFLSLARLYREQADSESAFGELKNQWGWAGFTTCDMKRYQIMARLIAVVHEWWRLFARSAELDHHREAITRRPPLLQGRAGCHAGRTRLTVTSCHGRRQTLRAP